MNKSRNKSRNKSDSHWPCPAKLNLFLSITGRREDGYHNLQSVFQLLDYGDTLDIKVDFSGQIIFDCNISELNQNDNLVVQAAKKLQLIAIQQETDIPPGAKLYLTKRLPAGGGIGGGSSDCATTLVALNHLWKLKLTPDQLAEIGLSLGADIPVFVKGYSAFVEGIGEILTPFKLPELWYLVIHPEVHVSTPKIFSNPLLTRNSKAITIRDLNAMELPFKGNNCMQTIVCNEYPEVRSALEWLKSQCSNARMTGSGSCLFATFDNEQKMRRIATRCDWPHFMAKGMNLSPLISKLKQ